MEPLAPTPQVSLFARVRGQPVVEFPRDLYIPPDALEVYLDSFEGPLDLLLYLIKRRNLDILDIPIADITRQYMRYIELMQELRLELAAEYLLMAAMLAQIKSRLLLPRAPEVEDEEDPRAALIRHLQEYERFKLVAEQLDELPRMERDLGDVIVDFPYRQSLQKHPDVSLNALLNAFQEVLVRAELYSHHQIAHEPLSVRERMSIVLGRLDTERFTGFHEMFTVAEGRAGVVVTLLAILELVRGSLIEMVQTEADGPLHLRAAT